MRSGLGSILLTLFILAVGFVVWFAGREYGWFYRKTAEEIIICGNVAKDTLYFRWKGRDYNINGFKTVSYYDDVLHVEVNLSRNYHDKERLVIDPERMHRLEIYGEILYIKDIPVCE